MSVEKHYTLVQIEIQPERTIVTDEGSELIPSRLFYAYKTEIIEDGNLLAVLPIHRGSAEFSDDAAVVIIAADMTTRTIAEIKAEAGL